MRATAVLAAVASIAAATACGGDGKREPKADRAQRAVQAEAQRRAEGSVLELGDLPQGWRAGPSRRSPAAEDMIRRCLGVDYSALTITGEAFSKDFRGQQSEASSKATVYAGAEQAQEAFAKNAQGMESPAAPDCFDAQIEELNGVEVGEVDVVRLSSSTQRGIEEAAGWQIVVSLTLSEDSPSRTFYLELVILRRGDTVATLRSTAMRPFPPSLRTELVRALARRMSRHRRQ